MTNLISSNGIYYDPYSTTNTSSAPLGLGGSSSIYTTTPTVAVPASTDTVSINSSSASSSSAASDGKDDGKLSLWEKVKSGVGGAVKGLVKGVVDTVTDPKKLLLAAGAIALSIACPPAGVALAVAGGVMGAVQVGKGVVKASNATTDAEAKAAYEDIGSGTMQVGLSVVGAKAGLKSCGATTEALAAESGAGVSGALAKAKNVGTALKEDALTSLKSNTGKLGENVSNAGLKDGVKQTWDESALSKNIEANGKVKGTVQTAKEKIADLKQSGADSVGRDVVEAKNSLSRKLSELEETGKTPTVASTAKNDLIADLKSSDISTKESLTAYLDKVKKSEVLTSTEKAEITSLAKQSHKASANLENINTKTATKQTKLEDKLLNKADKAVEAKKAELDVKVKNGEMTQEAANKEIATFQNDKLNEIVNQQVATQGSAVSGAKTQVTDLAEQTIKKNAEASAKKAGVTAQDATETAIQGTKDSISKLKARDGEIAKAQKAVKDAKADLAKAKAAGDDIKLGDAESKLQKAETTLSDTKATLSDLQTKLSAQQNLYNANQLATGAATKAQAASALSGYVAPTVANSVKGNNSDNVAVAATAASTDTTQTASTDTAQTSGTIDVDTLSANYAKQFINNQNYANYVPGVTYNA